MILYRAAKNMVKQTVTVIEWRHILGMVFDEDGILSLERELAIFERVQKQIRQLFPLFTMKIIVCGLKAVGKEHVQSQIDAYFAAAEHSNMVVGFDLVQEEDASPGIAEFLPQIYEAQCKAKKLGRTFDMYLHAGESNSRRNKELYDAVLLGTRRIGHGFHLAYHPSLIQVVKTKEICLECCPVSNFVLGYVLDMRNHPARGFLHQGLPVSINPDDPGFMGYDGVTLDYLYAFLSWDLDLADLEQLALNSLTYASIPEDEKQKILQFFDYKWQRFLDHVITRY